MRDHFLDRLYGEYQAYKVSVLSCSGAEIFNRCYEIDAITNFYEILAEKAEGFPDNVLEALLQCRDILTELYDLWLKKDDSCYREMQIHVEDEIKNMAMETGGDDIYGGYGKASES